jgi:hypothetical protein
MKNIIIKPKKAVLVTDKAMVELLTRKVAYFRDNAKLKDSAGIVRGIGLYALYGINHCAGHLVVLASEPTAADFNQYVTAKSKADKVRLYDHVVEYRDAGTVSNPKVTILCWTLDA